MVIGYLAICCVHIYVLCFLVLLLHSLFLSSVHINLAYFFGSWGRVSRMIAIDGFFILVLSFPRVCGDGSYFHASVRTSSPAGSVGN